MASAADTDPSGRVEALGYPLSMAAQLVGMKTGRLRSLVKGGLVPAHRGPDGALCLQFGELRVLRALRPLAGLAPRRLRQALVSWREASRTTDPTEPAGPARLIIEGDRVLIADSVRTWEPESGQLVLDLDPLEATDGHVIPVRPRGYGAETVPDLLSLETAVDLEMEAEDPGAAERLYRAVVERDPTHVSACINLGRLRHEAGEPGEAARLYRQALEAEPTNTTAWFNLGVALDDLGEPEHALSAYVCAIESDPMLADAHFNAARVCERIGDQVGALRHLRAYRALVR